MYTIHNEKYFIDDHIPYIVRDITQGLWIRILDAPGCYKCAVRAERKSALQCSGLVRAVGPCAKEE